MLFPVWLFVGFAGVGSILIYFLSLKQQKILIISGQSILLLIIWFCAILCFSYFTYESYLDVLNNPYSYISPSPEDIFFFNQLTVIIASCVFCALIVEGLLITWYLEKSLKME